jgi:hypothetical protein
VADNKRQYKQITFAKGYSKSFADFTAEFSGTHVFKGMNPKKRLIELKLAYKIAVNNGNSKKATSKVKTASDK